MKDRIQAILKEKNLSAVKFAEILDVQPSSISHLISGRNNPNFDFVTKVLTNFPEINPDWFLLGNGDMFRHSNETPLMSEKNLSLSLFDAESGIKKVPEGLPDLTALNQLPAENKQIKKIILLYTDQTFSVYESEKQ